MTYERFEDLPVWQKAAELYSQISDLLAQAPNQLSRSFRDQLERAAVSVSNNIAEGFERGTTNELLQFIYIARGSAGEVRSMLCLLDQRPWMADFRSQMSNLKSSAENCSRQLRSWADWLQISPVQGQRFLTEKSRKQSEDQKRAAECQKKLLRNLPQEHPLRRDAQARGLI